LQADFLAGKVRGKRANALAGAAQDDSHFTTRIDWSAALKGNFTIANLSLNNKRGVFSPYVTAGAGYMSSSPSVDYTSANAASDGYSENWFIPVGAGFKIGLSNTINLDFGYDVNFMKSKTFDGYNGGANDRFSYAHAGIEIALGKKS